MMKRSTANVIILKKVLEEQKKQTEELIKQTKIMMEQSEFIKSWMSQDKHYHDKTLEKL